MIGLFRNIALVGALTLLAACGAEAERAGYVPTPLETPAPSGTHGVGYQTRVIGGVNVIAYYPTATRAAATPAAQMTEPHIDNLTARFGADASARLAAGRGHAGENAPIAQSVWPVIVFAPGWRLAAHDYRTLLEDIASRGYVVLAIADSPASERPPYEETANAINAVVNGLATAESDAFMQSLDTTQIGAMGHSVGGAASSLAASQNEAIDAVVNLDGDFGGASEHALVRRPILYLTGSDPREQTHTHERRTRTFARITTDVDFAQAVQVRALRHFDFLDVALLRNEIREERRENRFGTLAPARGIALSSALSAAFFDQTLRGEADAFGLALAATPEAGRPAAAVAASAD
jgi:dienelactone hydrolase